MNEWLFSYGTLQQSEVQLRLFGRTVHGSRDILQGYKLLPIEIEDKNFLADRGEKNQLTVKLTDNAADSVEGTLLELRDEDLATADAYEPDNYERVRVQMASGKAAWVYVAV